MNPTAISKRSKAILAQRQFNSLLEQSQRFRNAIHTAFESAAVLEPNIQPDPNSLGQAISTLETLEALLLHARDLIDPLAVAIESGDYAQIWSVKNYGFSICVRTNNHVNGPLSCIKSGGELEADLYRLLRQEGIKSHLLRHGSEAELQIASNHSNPEQVTRLKWQVAEIMEKHGWSAIVLGESSSVCCVPETVEETPGATV
ncbi:hypothetical protein ACQ4M3_13320 [Leptolyngbya sp. AN03gr2]|uniref:hypothetical protein n=1 Tax=unclassified Leptolyngbya TaxID=2650499 RepID=UPI003D320F7C